VNPLPGAAAAAAHRLPTFLQHANVEGSGAYWCALYLVLLLLLLLRTACPPSCSMQMLEAQVRAGVPFTWCCCCCCAPPAHLPAASGCQGRMCVLEGSTGRLHTPMHTSTHPPTHTHTHTHVHTHAYTPPPPHTHTHSHTRAHPQNPSQHTHPPTQTLVHPPTHAPTLSHTRAHTCSPWQACPAGAAAGHTWGRGEGLSGSRAGRMVGGWGCARS